MKLTIPPVLQVAIAAGVMWGVSKVAPSFVVHFPGRLTIAVFLMLMGFAIAAMAIAMFYKAKTTVDPTSPSKANTLVIKGLYRISRNPMYLAMALLLAGWAVYLGSPLNLLVLAGFIQAMTLLQIKPEEEALREKFGDDYDDYRRRTRRWI